MEKLKIYRVEDRYIRFLKSRDSRVQDNKDRRRADILAHASATYFDVVNRKNKFLCSVSCDYLALEKACGQYDPCRRRKTP